MFIEQNRVLKKQTTRAIPFKFYKLYFAFIKGKKYAYKTIHFSHTAYT